MSIEVVSLLIFVIFLLIHKRHDGVEESCLMFSIQYLAVINV